ncbi:hypothetical protein [Endozoicomonas arenosclerae]|uniref:hypothetical protein n=1 Tax=Endozoicomonas arenosclerae TaxID=1633495 RepID=UPI000A748A3B|nr:hypothetical protein [Endozoicomonas arenosclerae]
MDFIYGLDQLRVVQKSDKDKTLIYSSYQKRPKKPLQKAPDGGWAGLIEGLGAAYQYAHDLVYTIKLPPFSKVNIKSLTLQFTESQYGQLGEAPGQLYRMRLMEQSYQAYGGWMSNLEHSLLHPIR